MPESSQGKANPELVRLYEQSAELRNQMEDYYKKGLEWKARREDLNRTRSPLAVKLKEEREQRNCANEKVAELKVLKQGFSKELEETKSLINELSTSKRELISSLRDDPDRVRERIRKLEWFLQTNVLSLSKENEVVKEISLLEKKLVETKMIDEVDAKLAPIVDRARALKNKLGELRTQLLEQVKVSQDHHSKAIDLMNQIGDLKKQADEAHENYIEAFNSASLTLSSLTKTQEKIRALNEKTNLEKTMKKNERMKDVQQRIEQIARQASEKVKKGGKLTMDELSVLVQKGFFNETQKS
nr:hypothetical protein [Candidatus Njordarchaeota archaeon]